MCFHVLLFRHRHANVLHISVIFVHTDCQLKQNSGDELMVNSNSNDSHRRNGDSQTAVNVATRDVISSNNSRSVLRFGAAEAVQAPSRSTPSRRTSGPSLRMNHLDSNLLSLWKGLEDLAQNGGLQLFIDALTIYRREEAMQQNVFENTNDSSMDIDYDRIRSIIRGSQGSIANSDSTSTLNAYSETLNIIPQTTSPHLYRNNQMQIQAEGQVQEYRSISDSVLRFDENIFGVDEDSSSSCFNIPSV